MTNEEAKFLLQVYRPDGSDAQDPQFAGALDQVQRDPALGEWFRNQQAFDSAMTGKLLEVPVPAAVKRDILAGCKTLRPRVWWRRPVVPALAACFLVCLGVVATLLTSAKGRDFARYRAEMVHVVMELESGHEPLQFTSREWPAIQSWLADHSDHQGMRLPSSLTLQPGVGCRLVDWRGGSVALICFRLNETGKVAHLLVLDQDQLRQEPGAVGGPWVSVQGLNTKAWTDRGKTFLLVSSASTETLDRLL